ncbi:FAS1-like dehydratase domain-containing protein [Aurantimonas marianensis]|uniref:MaoC family dehydratase N-terminal domain-containing protein n=1 Tax=Aurantimonas marianensis TaxID=2920428 RepID=A0A9X2HA94_9HYPH|nr:MaoC family dehydratase N-terminal domain-containing protein [Aurantimonas marianensis]MCP3056118.1 MaoC family dehydratase N-terminal domain-containing protein [Aurantimonas marianensis]
MTETIDIDHLKSWIGRTEEARDQIDARLVRSFLATLDRDPGNVSEGDPAPLCLHWCLAPPVVPNSATGPDGHPTRGGFLPPVPLPRRMWAGGELRFLAPLVVGDRVTRRSRIEDVQLKQGRSGPLCFVTVRHDILAKSVVAIEERQDIVYRAAATGGTAPVGRPEAAETPKGDVSRAFEPTPLALFRYSALTFNGHRIHYDRSYCLDEEHYPGLVVHGPLQATLLAHLAAETLGRTPAVFAYRGVKPLFDGKTMGLHARRDGDGCELWSSGADGVARMQATASV